MYIYKYDVTSSAPSAYARYIMGLWIGTTDKE